MERRKSRTEGFLRHNGIHRRNCEVAGMHRGGEKREGSGASPQVRVFGDLRTLGSRWHIPLEVPDSVAGPQFALIMNEITNGTKEGSTRCGTRYAPVSALIPQRKGPFTFPEITLSPGQVTSEPGLFSTCPPLFGGSGGCGVGRESQPSGYTGRCVPRRKCALQEVSSQEKLGSPPLKTTGEPRTSLRSWGP